MSQPETILIRVDGDDATITTTPQVAFRVIKAVSDAGHVVECKDSGGRWTTIDNSQQRKAA